MSICVDLDRFDYKKTKQKIKEFTKEENDLFIDKILNEFGTVIGNDYIVLNNEYCEEGNCFYKLIEFLERYYKLAEGEGYDLLVSLDKGMVEYKEIEFACKNLGISELEEYEECEE